MPQPSNPSKYWFWGLNAVLGLTFVLELVVAQPPSGLDYVLITLAAVACVEALHRQLPLQNVLPAALIIAAIGGVAHGVTASSGLAIPFGPIVFNPAAGFKIFNSVPWTVPLIWVVAIFSARGVARLILRPWRKVKNYGYWLIGFTSLLAAGFDVALEPYAWHVKHFWLWQKTKIAVTWEGCTLLDLVGWAFVSLLIMMFITPSLIRKQPGSSTAPDFHPLAIWLGALILFAVGFARTGWWLPFGVDVVIASVTTVFAVRGAKW